MSEYYTVVSNKGSSPAWSGPTHTLKRILNSSMNICCTFLHLEKSLNTAFNSAQVQGLNSTVAWNLAHGSDNSRGNDIWGFQESCWLKVKDLDREKRGKSLLRCKTEIREKRARQRGAAGGQGWGGFIRKRVQFSNCSSALGKASCTKRIFDSGFHLEASHTNENCCPTGPEKSYFFIFCKYMLGEQFYSSHIFPREATEGLNHPQ